MITSQDFASLTEELQSIFNQEAKQKISAMKGRDIFQVEDTSILNHLHQVIHGLGHPERLGQGQNIPVQNGDEGDSITYTQKWYGSGFAVTKTMRKFDMTSTIKAMPKSLATGAFDAVDQSMADVLLNGWSTSYTDVYNDSVSAVGPDGLALFNANHTYGDTQASGVYSNLLVDSDGNTDPVLSRDAIVASRTAGRKYTDGRSLNRGIDLDTLVVAPDNEDLAERILYSTQISGSANNDMNALKGKVKNLIVWDRLSENSAGTDTGAYWFMLNSAMAGETLKALFAERPTLDAPHDVYENKNWEYTVDFYYVLGLGFQPYVRGSKGTT